MKQILALLLCVVMLGACLVGCGKRAEGDNGPIFNAYVASEPFLMDPQINQTDDDAVMIMSLIFEGLTRINGDGKTEKAMLDSYSYTETPGGEYQLTMTIKESKWTDSRRVSADDFVYSWKRLLSSDFSSNAASLLFDVKNARAAKAGDASIDDIGIAAVDTYTIQVTFENDINVDDFLRKCASIAMVPMREDIVSKSSKSWSKKSTTMVANGPFAVKGMNYEEGTLRLERNAYYFRDEDDDLLKYVIPYRIFVTYLKDEDAKDADADKAPESLSAQLTEFVNGNIKMITDIPLANRSEYTKGKSVALADSGSTLSCLFNLNNPLFADARVRQALSSAVSRDDIASLIVYGKAATGLISNTCFEGSSKKSFRSVGGALLSTTADTSKAQQFLSDANVVGGSFTLTYRQTEEDIAVAEYLKDAWESLGFTVKLEPVLATSYVEVDKVTENENTFYNDVLTDKYNNGEYDVLLLDYQMVSVNPTAALANFAKAFSGNACDVENDWEIVGNICGFDDEAYNEIIEKVFAESDCAKRTTILHEAEAYLMEQMPVMPLVFNQNVTVTASDISGLEMLWGGIPDFRSVMLKDYLKYYPTED